MKILFVWTGVASYMADCWRELQKREDVELKVLIVDREGGYGTSFKDEDVIRGLDWTLARGASEVEKLGVGVDWKPEVIFIVGWREPLCREIATSEEYRDVPKICCFDMPWEWRVRKFVARFVLWRYLRRFVAAYVPGEVSSRYAKWLGFKRVEKGLFGIRVGERVGAGERKGFLFVGRLSPEKRIDVIAAAYRKYREAGGEWELDVYGQGVEARQFEGIEGVRMHGFVQPEEVRGAYARAGALVIASSWDPWPLVIAESCAAGVPVICSEHCWNHSELIRDNSFVVKVGDVDALARAMARAGELKAPEPEVVAPYSCEAWAERTARIAREVI